jgi:hypothetical protein
MRALRVGRRAARGWLRPSSASSTVSPSRTRPSVRPAAATRCCSAARIRAEVNHSDSNCVDTRTVGPTQHRGLADPIGWAGQRQRPGLQRLGNEQLNQLIDLVGCNVSGSYVALRFGADMPALPGRTPLLNRSQHFRGGRCHPVSAQGRARREGGVECLTDHVLDRIGSADCFGGLGVPGGALLG